MMARGGGLTHDELRKKRPHHPGIRAGRERGKYCRKRPRTRRQRWRAPRGAEVPRRSPQLLPLSAGDVSDPLPAARLLKEIIRAARPGETPLLGAPPAPRMISFSSRAAGSGSET